MLTCESEYGRGSDSKRQKQTQALKLCVACTRSRIAQDFIFFVLKIAIGEKQIGIAYGKLFIAKRLPNIQKWEHIWTRWSLRGRASNGPFVANSLPLTNGRRNPVGLPGILDARARRDATRDDPVPDIWCHSDYVHPKESGFCRIARRTSEESRPSSSR